MPTSTTPPSNKSDHDYVPSLVPRGSRQDMYDLDPEFPEKAPPTVVLASTPSAPPRIGSLSWLSHVLGLDLHGRRTLYGAAQTDMNAAALLLTIIFLFDVCTWGLLIYFLANGGTMEFRWTRAIFAVAGVLPAFALLVYERGFMTSDLSRDGQSRSRWMFALLLRCGVIFGAAYITAQPVELIAFNDRINRRIHEERLREMVVARATELTTEVKKREKVKGGQPEADRVIQETADTKTRIAKLRDELNQATQARTRAESALTEAQRIRNDAYVIRNRAETALENAGEPPPPALQRDLNAAQDRVGLANNAYRARKTEADAAVGSVQALTAELSRLTTDLTGLNEQSDVAKEFKSAGDRVKALKDWVMSVRNLAPGTPYLDPFTNTEIRLQDYDFLDKLRIITDLRKGNPPRWPNRSREDVELVQREYGLHDPHPDAMRVDAWNATGTYWGFFLVAIFVPFMSLLYKLIMPAHLSLYYSHAWQARQGNGPSISGQSWADHDDGRGPKDDRE